VIKNTFSSVTPLFLALSLPSLGLSIAIYGILGTTKQPSTSFLVSTSWFSTKLNIWQQFDQTEIPQCFSNLFDLCDSKHCKMGVFIRLLVLTCFVQLVCPEEYFEAQCRKVLGGDFNDQTIQDNWREWIEDGYVVIDCDDYCSKDSNKVNPG